jgi:hypothetical protein
MRLALAGVGIFNNRSYFSFLLKLALKPMSGFEVRGKKLLVQNVNQRDTVG